MTKVPSSVVQQQIRLCLSLFLNRNFLSHFLMNIFKVTTFLIMNLVIDIDPCYDILRNQDKFPAATTKYKARNKRHEQHVKSEIGSLELCFQE
ncbi:hypothetical protein T09_5335 [Trichinella sp. T9]|uniref:Uncharacterized protein n=1 Tax=Trichinella murrelli TaxID=144512 RepID=A0A0V0TGH5_9BILA|nr:hypothetical protein T05_440 [Trichinella murrelli]KRX61760.1 hypothetical protein T09_5335 [Trichinella sp. T9]